MGLIVRLVEIPSTRANQDFTVRLMGGIPVVSADTIRVVERGQGTITDSLTGVLKSDSSSLQSTEERKSSKGSNQKTVTEKTKLRQTMEGFLLGGKPKVFSEEEVDGFQKIIDFVLERMKSRVKIVRNNDSSIVHELLLSLVEFDYSLITKIREATNFEGETLGTVISVLKQVSNGVFHDEVEQILDYVKEVKQQEDKTNQKKVVSDFLSEVVKEWEQLNLVEVTAQSDSVVGKLIAQYKNALLAVVEVVTESGMIVNLDKITFALQQKVESGDCSAECGEKVLSWVMNFGGGISELV